MALVEVDRRENIGLGAVEGTPPAGPDALSAVLPLMALAIVAAATLGLVRETQGGGV